MLAAEGSPRNAENEPGSAANATNAGADHERHDPVNVHGQRTSRGAYLAQLLTRSFPKILYGFGRKDQLYRAAIKRLVGSWPGCWTRPTHWPRPRARS